MIELGLARISRLLTHTALPWRAIHVAGTNGKGSICASTSAMLHAAKIKCGRFTSPHLIDRWDCIAIDEKPIAESVFKAVEEEVQRRNQNEEIKASEFELLTATAFEIFTREKVEVGVVEVGMGGRLDATNVLESPLVTVISKIGCDHQAFLGNTIEEIARQKAGILKPGVPCVIDASNEKIVREVIKSVATSIGAGPLYEVAAGSDTESSHSYPLADVKFDWHRDLELHQQQNLACAVEAVRIGLKSLHCEAHAGTLANGAKNIQWPGRLQSLSIASIADRKRDVLLDGAHNVQSAESLGSYVQRRLRNSDQAITWVLASSQGKDLAGMLRPLLHPGDTVVAVTFRSVEGMPWVHAMPNEELVGAVKAQQAGIDTIEVGCDIQEVLRRAAAVSNEGPLVVAGSLYLVSDVLRLLRSKKEPG